MDVMRVYCEKDSLSGKCVQLFVMAGCARAEGRVAKLFFEVRSLKTELHLDFDFQLHWVTCNFTTSVPRYIHICKTTISGFALSVLRNTSIAISEL